MSLTKNISHLKKLESINPDKRWERTSKFDLLEEISSQNRLMQAHKLSNNEKIDLFVMRAFNRMAPVMSKALTVFLVFSMFFGVNIAAQASVPGQPLWPVKRSIEEAEVSLTFSSVKKAEVHIKHANERLDEIDKILDKPEEVNKPELKVQKQKAIKQAVTHLEKDVVSVDSNLKVAKEEKGAVEVVELVKKVTVASKEVDKSLNEKKKKVEAEVQDEELQDAINKVKTVNKQVKKAAVAVAVEVHEKVTKADELKVVLTTAETPKDASGQQEPEVANTETETTTPEMLSKKEVIKIDIDEEVSQEEVEVIKSLVKEIVASEIEDLSQEVKQVKEKADIVNQIDIDDIKKTNLKDSEFAAIGTAANSGVEDEELKDIDTIKQETSQEAETIIEEAKVLLESGLVKDAFERVAQTQEKYDKAGEALERIEKVIEDKIVEEQESEEAQKQEATEETNTEQPVVGETPVSSPNLDIKPEDEIEENIESSGVDINKEESKTTSQNNTLGREEEPVI